MVKRASLLAYALSRMVLALPMLLVLLTVVFVVLRILPGDPIVALYGGRAPPDVVAAARARYGLDKPYWDQFAIYIQQIFTGNFGTSLGEIYRGKGVWDTILLKMPATIELAIGAMLVSSFVGISTGLIGGINRDKPVDVAVRLYGTTIFAVPIFWLGLMLQLVFGVALGWLPASLRFSPNLSPAPRVTGLYTIDSLIAGDWTDFVDAVRHLILPCVTLGLYLSGFFTKTVRANLLLTVDSDYAEAARARGVRRRTIVRRYAFKNALIPVVTILGLQFAVLFGGAVLTEHTFSWDGMGTLLLDSINSKDYPMIQGTIVTYAFIIVVVSLIIDLINGLIDPRIRY
jgi:peptide/nickel transport system permease protein